MLVRLASVILFGLALGSATAEAAGPTKSDPKFAARALAVHGYAMYEAGRYAEAIDALDHAERLYHAPTLVFALARAHAAMGKLVEARALFQKVADEKLGPDAIKAFQDVQRSAPGEVAALDKRIPTLAILVRGGGGKSLRVSIDEVEVAYAGPGHALPINPGSHRVTVVPLGGVGQARSITLQEGERASVTIELAGAAPLVVPVAAPPVSDAPRPWRVPAYVSFGVGGAGLLLGVGAGIFTVVKAAELNEACPSGKCLTSEHDADIRLGRAMGVTTTVGFVVAGAGAALGTVLLLVKPGAASGPAISAGVGPGSIELRGRF